MRHKQQGEVENLRSKMTAIEEEKKTVALILADEKAEGSRMEGEIKALSRAQK